MPLAFLFYVHGFEPRWECEAEETRSVFQRSPQEAWKPVETHGRFHGGACKGCGPVAKGGQCGRWPASG